MPEKTRGLTKSSILNQAVILPTVGYKKEEFREAKSGRLKAKTELGKITEKEKLIIQKRQFCQNREKMVISLSWPIAKILLSVGIWLVIASFFINTFPT